MKSENVETSQRQNADTARAWIFMRANVVPCGAITDEATHEIVLVPDGRTKNLNGVEWIIDEEAWGLIESAFRAHGVAIPIDLVHESLDEGVAPKDLLGAVGWVEDIRYEKGRGIFGKVSWNEEGKRRIRSGQFRYLSPVLGIRGKDRRAMELHSVGLVNKPAIPHMERMAAKQTNELPAGQRKEVSMDELKLIGKDLGLAEADCTVEKITNKFGETKKRGDAATAVANAARKALALKEDASESEVAVAINSLKQGIDAVKAHASELADLKGKMAVKEANDRVAPWIANNRINPNATEDLAMCRELAKSNPERFEKLMTERQPYAEPGRTTPPAGGANTAAGQEEELIANAVKEHKGMYADAIVALQVKLKKPYVEQGLTQKAANAACTQKYPKIFAA